MQFLSAQPAQYAAIQDLFLQTFSDSEGAEEGQLIGGLVQRLLADTPADDLRVHLASDNAVLVGGIIWSRLRFEAADAPLTFLMAPVAVRTDQQGKGVGQALIQWGLQRMQSEGVQLALTYGDPHFYGRVGFQAISTAQVPAPLTLSHPEGWLGQLLNGESLEALQITGASRCVEAFDDGRFW